MINVNIVRSIQITNNLGILTGISVERIHGIRAEKNITAEIDNVPITNFVTKGASTTNKAGKNISAISIAAAFAANSGSGICKIHVNGCYYCYKVYALFFQNTS